MFNTEIDRMLNPRYSYQFSNYINYYNDVFLDQVTEEQENIKFPECERFSYSADKNIEISCKSRVRYEKTSNEEFWNIFINDNVMKISSRSKKLTVQERKFLRSAKGMRFLVNCSNKGINSLAQLKRELKNLDIC